MKQEEIDLIADIAWYIKGMIAAGDVTFNHEHIKALEVATTKAMKS